MLSQKNKTSFSGDLTKNCEKNSKENLSQPVAVGNETKTIREGGQTLLSCARTREKRVMICLSSYCLLVVVFFKRENNKQGIKTRKSASTWKMMLPTHNHYKSGLERGKLIREQPRSFNLLTWALLFYVIQYNLKFKQNKTKLHYGI